MALQSRDTASEENALCGDAFLVKVSKRQTNPRKTGLFRTKVRLRDFRGQYSALNYVK
jgi:hypothetical protein